MKENLKSVEIKMNEFERVEMLCEAQEKLFEVINLIEDATEGDINVDTYLLAPMRIMASNDHGYLSDDLNIDKVIDRVKNEVSDDEY